MDGPPPITDREIARQVRADANQGAELLLRVYGARLKGTLRPRFPGLWEDITSMTIVKAVRAIKENYDDSQPLWPYLAKIALRTGFDAVQKEAKHDHVAPPHGLDDPHEPLEIVLGQERLRRAEAIIETLPELERLVLETILRQGSLKSLAERLEQNVNTIYGVASRARRKLIEGLSDG